RQGLLRPRRPPRVCAAHRLVARRGGTRAGIARRLPAAELARRPSIGPAVLVRGYCDASSAERAGFCVLSSFAGTIAVSRAVNYVRERRRPFPRIRGLVRRIY